MIMIAETAMNTNLNTLAFKILCILLTLTFLQECLILQCTLSRN